MRIAVALVGVLALAGCVAAPPPGASESEISALQERSLEQTWERTGLDGDPPAVEPGPAVASDAWGQTVYDCVLQQGFVLRGFEWSPDHGASLGADSGNDVDDPGLQRAFYECIAANPRAIDEHTIALTDAQLDYIYDYYLKSLVPCMVLNGFTPSTAPTREEFLAIRGQWSPYYSVDVGLSSIQFDQIEQTCGPERPQLY